MKVSMLLALLTYTLNQSHTHQRSQLSHATYPYGQNHDIHLREMTFDPKHSNPQVFVLTSHQLQPIPKSLIPKLPKN